MSQRRRCRRAVLSRRAVHTAGRPSTRGDAGLGRSGGPMGTIRRLLCAGVCAGFPMLPGVALAWGDEGHEVVALVAQHYLDPAVRQKVEAMLAADDTDPAVPHDIAHEATWADKYRDSSRERYNATHQWHFVDLEIDDPNLDQACFGRPGLSQDTPASEGSDRDCVVDKIDEF